MLEEVARRSLNLLQLILFLIYPQETSHNTFLFNTLRRGTNAGYQVNINELNNQKYIQLYPANFRFQIFLQQLLQNLFKSALYIGVFRVTRVISADIPRYLEYQLPFLHLRMTYYMEITLRLIIFVLTTIKQYQYLLQSLLLMPLLHPETWSMSREIQGDSRMEARTINPSIRFTAALNF